MCLAAAAAFAVAALSLVGCVWVSGTRVKTGKTVGAASKPATQTQADNTAALERSAMEAAHRKAAEVTRRDWFLIKPRSSVAFTDPSGTVWAGVNVHVSGFGDALYVLRSRGSGGEWVVLGYGAGAKKGAPRYGVPASVWDRFFQ